MCVDCVLTSPRIAQVDPGDEPLPEVVLSQGGLDRYKVSHLGQSVHDYPNGVISKLSSRQPYGKIHGNLFPLTLSHLQ
jgi:hypothetical protein